MPRIVVVRPGAIRVGPSVSDSRGARSPVAPPSSPSRRRISICIAASTASIFRAPPRAPPRGRDRSRRPRRPRRRRRRRPTFATRAVVVVPSLPQRRHQRGGLIAAEGDGRDDAAARSIAPARVRPGPPRRVELLVDGRPSRRHRRRGIGRSFGNVRCTVNSSGFLPDPSRGLQFVPGGQVERRAVRPGHPTPTPTPTPTHPGRREPLFVFGDAAPIATDPPADGPMADRSEPKPIGPALGPLDVRLVDAPNRLLLTPHLRLFRRAPDIIHPSPRSHAAEDSAAVAEAASRARARAWWPERRTWACPVAARPRRLRSF